MSPRISLTALLALLAAGPLQAQSVLFVNASAPPSGDGLAWETAYTDLQDALDQAHQPGSPVKEVWVAAGTYRPDQGTGNRTLAFNLKSGLMVLGGFSGVEASRSQRDWAANPTILSGDLAGDDQPGLTGIAENSYHILTANLLACSTALSSRAATPTAAASTARAAASGWKPAT